MQEEGNLSEEMKVKEEDDVVRIKGKREGPVTERPTIALLDGLYD